MQRIAAEHSGLSVGAASISVQAAVHSIHHAVHGLALVVAVNEVFADAIIEGIDETSLQRGISKIAPRTWSITCTNLSSFHGIALSLLPGRKVYAPAQAGFVRKPT